MVGSTQWMAQREKIYNDKGKRVQGACQDYSDLKKIKTHGKSFSFDLMNHLAICMNANVSFTIIYCLQELWKDQTEGWIHRMDEKHDITLRPQA